MACMVYQLYTTYTLFPIVQLVMWRCLARENIPKSRKKKRSKLNIVYIGLWYIVTISLQAKESLYKNEDSRTTRKHGKWWRILSITTSCVPLYCPTICFGYKCTTYRRICVTLCQLDTMSGKFVQTYGRSKNIYRSGAPE